MQQAVLKIPMELILGVIILIAVVEGLDIPGRRELEERERDIKNKAPETMSIKYHDENGRKVEIILKKVFNTIPSALMPIWDITNDEDISAEHLLENFVAVCYHGVTSRSAITYFPHTETLHGVIDYRFYIEDLPRSQSQNPAVVDFHMHRMQGNLKLPNLPLVHHYDGRRVGPGTGNKLHCLLDQRSKNTLYAEILLVVDSVVRIDYYNPVEPHKRVVMYALAYWNAVDMLFTHLAGVEIKINIAGMVVGETPDIVEHFLGEEFTTDDDSQIYIENHLALDKLGSFFHNRRIEVKRDAYDFLFWMTQSSLLIPQGQNPGGPHLGISSPPTDCGGTHEEETVSRKISNRALIMHDAEYSNYHTAARELASLMFVSIDDLRKPDSGTYGSSRGIMDPANLRIEGCLRWSHQSHREFMKYASSKSSCCLLNYPHRTMAEPSTPVKKLSVDTQCNCYKMDAEEKMDKDKNICSSPLKCQADRGQLESVGLPLDGTPCQHNDNAGYCRSNVCVLGSSAEALLGKVHQVVTI